MKYIFWVVFLYVFILTTTGVSALVSIEDRTQYLQNSKVEMSLPDSSIFRLKGSSEDSLTYWLQVLDPQDRDKSVYIVIPSNGLVVPVNYIPRDSDDYKNALQGKQININTYLKDGVLEYPGGIKAGYGQEGNRVLFGHSSYWKYDDGRYKTHFQKIIELEVGEKIWVYKKGREELYTKYVYTVEESYNTQAEDTSIMLPKGGSELTLVTCTPIGGTSGRWIIKGKYESTVTNIDNFTRISEAEKKQIIEALSQIAKNEGREKLLQMRRNIVPFIENGTYGKYKELLQFIDYQLDVQIKMIGE